MIDFKGKELQVGRMGQYLVLYNLLKNGYQAYATDEGLPYDIVVDLGEKLIRLQVKSTLKSRLFNKKYPTPVYCFCVRRCGKGSKRIYKENEFDGFALVALDVEKIAYIKFDKSINKSILLRDKREEYTLNHARTNPYIDEFPLIKFMEEFNGKLD